MLSRQIEWNGRNGFELNGRPVDVIPVGSPRAIRLGEHESLSYVLDHVNRESLKRREYYCISDSSGAVHAIQFYKLK